MSQLSDETDFDSVRESQKKVQNNNRAAIKLTTSISSMSLTDKTLVTISEQIADVVDSINVSTECQSSLNKEMIKQIGALNEQNKQILEVK